jgi:ClpP class serine protease
MVDGTQALYETLKNCTKPTLAFVDDGTCASAAYEIAAGCDEIWASKNTDRVGSIGTMISIYNLDKMYEKEGIQMHDIYATKSTDKNKMYKEASQGNYKKIVAQMLDPMNEEFINAIKSSRPKVSANALTGELFMASKALELGLIDQVGSYADAITYLSNKAKSFKSTKTPQNNSMKTFWKELFPSAKSEAEAEKQFESKIESSEKYTSLVNENAAFKTETETLKTKVTALESEVSTLTAANEALTAENESYSKIAGTTHTNPIKSEIEETVSLETEPTSEDILRNGKNAAFARQFLPE